jgi:CelD/BcsL family acetyltransferase involved in cellulose biosynthesis
LAGTFSEYLQRHSAKSRHNLKRSVKKLLERNPGGVLEIASEEKQMAAFHHAAVAISRRTYQERLLGAGLPNTAEYLCEMQSLARRGEARGYLLRDRGQAIAFAWCSAHGRLITYNVIGYLPECSALSPGTVLLYLILEDLFQTGIYSVLDFGVGESFYKQAFATHHIDFSTAYLFRPEWRYTWRVWLHWWLDRVSSGLGRLLDRLGLKHLVRGLVWKLWCRRRDYDAKPLNSHFRGSSVRGSQ